MKVYILNSPLMIREGEKVFSSLEKAKEKFREWLNENCVEVVFREWRVGVWLCEVNGKSYYGIIREVAVDE